MKTGLTISGVVAFVFLSTTVSLAARTIQESTGATIPSEARGPAEKGLLLAVALTGALAGGGILNDRLIYKLSGRFSQSRVRRVIGRLEGGLGENLRHRFNRAYFHRYMKDQLGHFMLEVDPGPFPPKDLIMGTFVLNESEIPKKLNPDFYFSSGYGHVMWWLRTAEKHGFNIRTATAVMEFGCGTARLLRHFRCVDGLRIVGTDLNAENIRWCRESLPGIEFHQNQLTPPLTFAEDGSFDFVYAASVFTHIPLDTQALWIREMRRILKPGGFLLCDVLGHYHQEHMLDPNDLNRLRTEGNLTLTRDDAKASLSTQVIGSWDVFMTRQQFLKAFSAEFTVCDYLPGLIDLLVLKKPLA